VSGDLLAGAGVVVAAASAAAAILLPPSRWRAAAMLLALGLAPLLVLADQWDSNQVADLRDSPRRLLVLTGGVAALTAALFALFRRRPELFALAVIATLPFRVPLHAGGDQANLLVPLYLVIAAGVAMAAVRDLGATGPIAPAAAHSRFPWLPRLLAAFVLLYAAQSLYSEDFSQGLQNACFFFVPFSLAYVLLGEVSWSRRLLALALVVVLAEAIAFVLVGFAQYATRELLWNNAVIRSNEFHVYFRVNSLFWDPNVLGRYLAIAIILASAALLWTRARRLPLALGAVAVVLWLGLAITFSQSSFAALLAGLATLAALRWSLRWTAAVCAGAAVVAVTLALAAGESLEVDLSTDDKVNKETGGRANLVSGGVELFADRPVWGYGTGSFSPAFREHVAEGRAPVSESHTEPVTVAAEQGLIGLAFFAALLAAAFAVLCAGLRGLMPGLQRGPPAKDADSTLTAARAAVLAAFIALLVHTIAYAGLFEDPITWVLLAAGGALAAGGREQPPASAY